MTNKTEMMSVPRGVLEFWQKLLAPSVEAPDICHSSWDQWEMDCAEQVDVIHELLKSEPCANSQVAAPAEDVRAVVEEPVAWLDTESGALATAELKAFLDSGFETPLYRHPQRPVVLPEREMYTRYLRGVIPENRLEVEAYKDGWNACLDAVEALNK